MMRMMCCSFFAGQTCANRSVLLLLLLLLSFATTTTAAGDMYYRPYWGSNRPRYLTYTPYWGLSNQLQELNVAANWARFLNRVLILPTYFQSRPDPFGVEPEYNDCLTNHHPNCEPMANLIDVAQLRKYVEVVLEQDYRQDSPSDPFVVDFGIDFSHKSLRTKYLIRWMEDPDRNVLHSYRTPIDPNSWCQHGILVGEYRCQRSAQELVDVAAAIIHFPTFSTFTVGRIYASTAQRRDVLNKVSNKYIGPSKAVIQVARQVRQQLMGALHTRYNAAHVRMGDFLTERASLVKSNKDRAAALYQDLEDPELPLYIATNDDGRVPEILKAYTAAGFQQVMMWPTGEMEGEVSILTRSMAEQNILAGAEQFDAQPGSTFSGYVELVRSSLSLLKLHGYLEL